MIEPFVTWVLYRPGGVGPDVSLKTGVRKSTDPAEVARAALQTYAAEEPTWYVNVYGDPDRLLAWADWEGEDGAVRSATTEPEPSRAR